VSTVRADLDSTGASLVADSVYGAATSEASWPGNAFVPPRNPNPRFLERNAVWSEDLGRVRLTASSLPLTLLTPYGDWWDAPAFLPNFGKTSARARRAQAAWLTKIRKSLS